MKKNELFKPIGDEIKSHFDFDENLTKKGYFKFLLIKDVDKNNWQILLSNPQKSKLHADALLIYMKDFRLSEIIVHGGGYITLDPNSTDVVVTGKSFGFNRVKINEITSAFKTYFPKWNISFDDLSPLEQEDELSHRTYTLEEIRKKAQ